MTDTLAEAAGRPVSRETLDRLELYAGLLREENERQNLVARGTLDSLWPRHILDSAQLVRFEPCPGSSWVDIGSGAGLPGLVIACLVAGPVTLVEPRRLRADFLGRASEVLGLSDRIRVLAAKAERVEGQFDVITARAVAPLDRLLEISHHLSTGNSRFVLPRGRGAQSELAAAMQAWQGAFHVERSVTDAESQILVATGVRRR